jgi:hypothetical protein
MQKLDGGWELQNDAYNVGEDNDDDEMDVDGDDEGLADGMKRMALNEEEDDEDESLDPEKTLAESKEAVRQLIAARRM